MLGVNSEVLALRVPVPGKQVEAFVYRLRLRTNGKDDLHPEQRHECKHQ